MPNLFFGGSFNPIHHGHLICARAVAEARGYDSVVLIPSHQSPHKPTITASGATLAPPHHRLAMCRLAAAHSPGFQVDDLEIARAGVSYTLDTVRLLQPQNSGPIDWLIGSDMLPTLPNWHNPLALLAEACLIIMARPGWTCDWEALPPPYRSLRANVVEAPLIQIGATDIRARLAAGLPIDFLTPPPVVSYIRDQGLYR
jgi:nicotinate-nucleotide adenylyltransferase